MVVHINNVFGPNNIYYGRQWNSDAVDHHAAEILKTTSETWKEQPKTSSRIALDIGCSDGQKAFDLAKHEIFDHVVAIDIENRTDNINEKNRQLASTKGASNNPLTPIEFMLASVVDLKPDMFDGEVVHINFRRAAHFLAPQDLRKALTIIRDIAAPNALVTITFDGVTRNDFADYTPLSEDLPDFYDNRERLDKGLAPYTRYMAEEVIAFMEELGFAVSIDKIPGEKKDFRSGEIHIIAIAPDETSSLQPRSNPNAHREALRYSFALAQE